MTNQPTPWAAPATPGTTVPGQPAPAVNRETGFDRAVYALLLPALLIPTLVVVAALWDSTAHPTLYDFEWLVVLFFQMPVTLSMMLNTWLLLRHPNSYSRRALPRKLSITLVILWGTLVLWALLFPTNTTWILGFVFGLAVIVLSILVFTFALARNREKVTAAPVEDAPLPAYPAVLGWLYVGLSVAALVAGGLFSISGGPIAMLGMAAFFGLPWTIVTSIIGMAGYFGGSLVYGFVVAGLSALAVLFNVGAVLMLLLRPEFRTRFVNWFFKLRGAAPAATAGGAPIVPAPIKPPPVPGA